MAKSNGNGAVRGVSGMAFNIPEALVTEVYRSSEPEKADKLYVTLKFRDGGELKFGTDQIGPESDDALYGAKISVSGVFRPRRFGKDQSLETVGTLQIGAAASAQPA